MVEDNLDLIIRQHLLSLIGKEVTLQINTFIEQALYMKEVKDVHVEEYEKDVDMYYEIEYINYADEDDTFTIWNYPISDIYITNEEERELYAPDRLMFKLLIDNPDDDDSRIEFYVTEE